MTKYAVMRNGKLNLSGGNWAKISKADAHNRRLKCEVSKDEPALKDGEQVKKPRPKINIDDARTKFNISLVEGDPDQDLKSRITTRLEEVGITSWRQNAVVAREVILTTSPEYWGDWQSEIETPAFKEKLERWQKASMKYMEDYFGKDNVIQAELHLDETTPHIHVIAVPIVQRDKGAALCAFEQMSKKKLQDMQTGYAKEMEPFGLERGVEGSKAKHRHYSQYKDDKALKAQITIELKQANFPENEKKQIEQDSWNAAMKLAQGELSKVKMAFKNENDGLLKEQLDWRRLQNERYRSLNAEKERLAKELDQAQAAIAEKDNFISAMEAERNDLLEQQAKHMQAFKKAVFEQADAYRDDFNYSSGFEKWFNDWQECQKALGEPARDPGDVLGENVDREARHREARNQQQQREKDTDLSRE